jgi:hypothetical protein
MGGGELGRREKKRKEEDLGKESGSGQGRKVYRSVACLLVAKLEKDGHYLNGESRVCGGVAMTGEVDINNSHSSLPQIRSPRCWELRDHVQSITRLVGATPQTGDDAGCRDDA